LSIGRLTELVEFWDSLDVAVAPGCGDWIDLVSNMTEGDFSQADSLLEVNADPISVAHWTVRSLTVLRGRVLTVHRGAAGREALILKVAYGIPGPTDNVLELTSRGWSQVHSYILHGVQAALAGDTTESKRVLARIAAMSDSATSERFEWAFGPMLAVIEARLALRRSDWRSAVDLLEPWVRRLREPGYGFNAGDTYLTWLTLADAYQEMGQPDSAILHLESIIGPPRHQYLDHRLYAMPYPLAQFKLGQLYAQLGNTEKALQHYGRFLEVFTDPEPEYEWMVSQARAALEGLGRGR